MLLGGEATFTTFELHQVFPTHSEGLISCLDCAGSRILVLDSVHAAMCAPGNRHCVCMVAGQALDPSVVYVHTKPE